MWQWVLDHPEFIVLCLQGVVLGGIWLLKRSFASKADIDEAVEKFRGEVNETLKGQADELKTIAAAHTKTAGELVRLEQTLKSLPTSEDINEIKLSISEMEGDYKAISENVRNMKDNIGGIGKSVERIEDWLMTGKGKTA